MGRYRFGCTRGEKWFSLNGSVLRALSGALSLVFHYRLSCLIFGVILFCPPQQALAQAYSGDDDYEEPTDSDYQRARMQAKKDFGEAGELVVESIERAYDVLNDYKNQHIKKIARDVPRRAVARTLHGHKAPEQHPLDRFGGHLPEPFSWLEYVGDSKTILNRATLPGCLEMRRVAKKHHHALNMLNPAYAAACALNCPDLLFLVQDWEVIEYYWPQYVVAVNKAGAREFDPRMADEGREKDLPRLPTQRTIEQGRRREKQMLANMGVAMSKYKKPEWNYPGSEMHTQMDLNNIDDGIRFGGASRPNAMWRAANDRPRGVARHLGWRLNNKCLFAALDLPTSQKKIFTNYYEQRLYRWASQYPEFRRLIDRERYKYTTLPSLDIFRAADDTTYQRSLCASYRMNYDLYKPLEKAGIRTVRGNKYRDYCLVRSGGQLDGSMTSNAFMPVLQQDAIRAFMSAIWMGSTLRGLRSMNTEPRRLVKFTLHKNRNSIKRPGYFAYQMAGEPLEQHITFVDKGQRIKPNNGGGDGKPGPTNFIARMFYRGSQCFRPQNIPNWEAADEKTKTEWPLGLLLDTSKHYGETRWAIWNKRIVCTCEILGMWSGCLTLNNGDHDEGKFAGIVPYLKPHKVFTNALPIIDKLATKTSKPRRVAPTDDGLDLEALTLDVGKPGPEVGPIPPSLNQLLPPELSAEFLLCMATQGLGGQSGGGQPGGGNGGGGQGPGGGTGGGAGGGADGGSGGGSGGGSSGSGGSVGGGGGGCSSGG